MAIWYAWFVGAALGSPELEIERGLAAQQREAYGEARDRALAALREVPGSSEAQQLYIDATSAAGFGSRALKEVSALPADPPPWAPLVADLRQGLRDDDTKLVRATYQRLVEEHADHPELVAPIFGSDALRIKLLALKAQRRLLSSRARSEADLVGLYRMRRLAVDAGRTEAIGPIDEALAEQGEPPLPERPPYDRIERTLYAERLVASDDVPLAGYPSELVDVVDRAARLLAKGARYDREAALYQDLQQLTGAPEAWSGEAEAWQEAGANDRAQSAVIEAIAHAADPRPSDLGADDADRQRETLARALLVSARVHEALGDVAEAQIGLALAHQLVGRVLDDKLAERIAKGRRALDADLQSRYLGRGDPAAIAMRQARASDDPEVIGARVRDALLLATMGTKGSLRIARDPEPYAQAFALPVLLRSRVAAGQGRIRLARSYAVLATLLAGDSEPFWWAERAGLQHDLEERDAAFVSYARARSLGVPEMETLLEQTWIGLGDWRIAAEHAGGPPSDAADLVAPDDAASAVVTRGSAAASSAPQLGRPMPSFVIPTRQGRIDSAFLRGRIVVLSFFDTTCDACLQMLPQFGTVARRLRDRGLDAVVIAVSMDRSPKAYERVAHIGGHWGEVAHDPALGLRFGVERLPTTWVIDPSGTARFYIDHWISGDELLDYIGQMR